MSVRRILFPYYVWPDKTYLMQLVWRPGILPSLIYIYLSSRFVYVQSSVVYFIFFYEYFLDARAQREVTLAEVDC